MMLTAFADCCLWMEVVIDALWQQLPTTYKRRSGPTPRCSESELLTLALVGEGRGWTTETTLRSHWAAYPQLVPVLPERSRCNRRRRPLQHALNAIRQAVLAVLDGAPDRHCAIDRLPVPVLQFHFVLAPASASAVVVGGALLREHANLVVIGDNGDSSAPLAHALREAHAVRLLTVPRRTQHHQLPAAVARRRNGLRQIIETVNGQLTEQFGLARHHAHTFAGLCARLHTTLAAHTRCLWRNRLLGHADFLHIKRLAFPAN